MADQVEVCQTPVCCIPEVDGKCNKDCDFKRLDRPYQIMLALAAALKEVLCHCQLAVPDAPPVIDIVESSVPQAAKGGCGCQGIAVAIGPGTTKVTYSNCVPEPTYMPFTVKLSRCRASAVNNQGRPPQGELDGSTINSVNGATLEITRDFQAIRSNFINMLKSAACSDGTKIIADCEKIKDVDFAFSKNGKCNVIVVKLKIRI